MKSRAVLVPALCLSALALFFIRSGSRASMETVDLGQAPPRDTSHIDEQVLAQPPVAHTKRVEAIPQIRGLAPAQARSPGTREDTVKIYGFVRFRDGSPVEAATIKVPTQHGTLRTTTDRRGWYEIDAIERGLWRIRVSLGSDWRNRETLDARGGGAAFEHNFVIETWAPLRIFLFDRHGRPFEDSALAQLMTRGRLHLSFVASREKLPDKEIDWQGELLESLYKIKVRMLNRTGTKTNLPPGLLCVAYVQNPTPVWLTLFAKGVPIDCEYAVTPGADLTFTVDQEMIRARTATLRGKFVGSSAERGSWVKFVLYRPNGGRGHQNHVYNIGEEFRLDSIRPGQVTLVARFEGFAPLEVPLLLEAGKTLDLGALEFQAPLSITGWVNSAARLKREWSGISIRRLEWPEEMSQWEEVNPEPGKFEINGLAAGKYSLQAETGIDDKHILLSKVVVVDTSSGSIQGVRLELERPVRVRFQLESKRITRGSMLVVKTLDGLVVTTFPEYEAKNGHHLLPGDYILELRDRGVLKDTMVTTVGNGDDQVIQFDIE